MRIKKVQTDVQEDGKIPKKSGNMQETDEKEISNK